MIQSLQWSVLIILSGIVCSFVAPFPLITIPLIIGSLAVYLINQDKLLPRIGFLAGLWSVYTSIVVMFLNSGGETSMQGVYLLIAFAETLFYFLTVLILQFVLNTDHSTEEEPDNVQIAQS